MLTALLDLARSLTASLRTLSLVHCRKALVVGVAGLALLVGALALNPENGFRASILRRLACGPAPSAHCDPPPEVSVKTPGIYTRERLLNDRFKDLQWLEDQIALTNASFVPRVAISNQGTGTSVAYGEASPSQAPAALEKLPDRPLPTEERLEQLQRYRDRIRAKARQTMLDDRHDIDGNTLHLLSFTTSIRPPAFNSRPILLEVQFCPPFGAILLLRTECKISHGNINREILLISEIYHRWHRYMQKISSRSFENLLELKFNAIPPEWLVFYTDALDQELCVLVH